MTTTITSTTDTQQAINAAASDSRPSADPGTITVWSTTDDHQARQTAADAGPPERSLGNITVSSTTDSEAEVNRAADLYGETEHAEAGEENITPITMSEDGRVATTTDSEETVAAVQREMEAEREDKPDYLGRSSARRRINQLIKERELARAEAEVLRQQLETRQPPVGPDAEPDSEQPQPQQLTLEQQRQLRASQEYELKKLEAEVQAPLRYQLAKTKYPNLDAELAQCPLLPLPIIDALKTQPDGYDVAVFLARNPGYAHAVRDSFQAGDVARAAGILDHVSNGLKFEARQNPPQQPRQQHPQSNGQPAPRPLRHVGGASSSSSQIDPDKMSQRDYNAWRNSGGGR